MKGALVSATSLAALLALEVGIGVALNAPAAIAQSLWGTPGNTNFGYLLLNTDGASSATVAEPMTNASTQKTAVTIPALGSGSGAPLSGANPSAVFSQDDETASTIHIVPPTVTGAYSATATVIGRYGGRTASKVTLAGTAVAPVQHTTISAFGAAHFASTVTIAAITVPKAGAGDPLTAGSTLNSAQLPTSIGAASSSVFKGNGRTFSRNDENYASGTSGTGKSTGSAVVTDTHPRISDGAAVVASFSHGGSTGTNAAQTAALTSTGSGVRPTYARNIDDAVYSKSTNVGTTTIAAGTISVTAAGIGATGMVSITPSDISRDVAAASLTDLTLESFALRGPSPAGFSIVDFTTDAVAAEARSVTVMLDIRGSTAGNYDADLTLTSDDGAPLGGSGAVIMYTVNPTIPVPEE